MKQHNIFITGAAAEKPMRNILGMNNIARISSVKNIEFERDLFDALKLKHIRFHDATAENPAFHIIDVQNIFPLLHLDETDSRNYFFAQTDDYLAMLQERDVDIDFRIGETIDHSPCARRIGVPEDIEKWARVCRNIIAHYKNGEMNGMHLNITRVTVWEEPDNFRLFGGTPEQYARMFCALYKILKRDFPEIKVGGPSMMIGRCDFLQTFLENCKKEGVTPDYISSTLYALKTEEFVALLEKYHDITDAFGLKDIPQSIVEWHMAPEKWDFRIPDAYIRFFQTDNAAFTCEALMKFMDIDYVDTAYYYAWGVSTWSVLNQFNPHGLTIMPVYYGLLFFQKLAAECAQRLQVKTDTDETVHCLAGIAPDGRTRLLINCFNSTSCAISCHVPGAKACSVLAIREDYCEKDALEAAALPESDGCFTLQHDGKNGVYLLEFA